MDQGNTSNTTTEYDPKAHIYLIFKYGRLVTSFVALFTNILVVITFCISWKYWRHSINILLLTLASVDIIGNGVSFVYFLTTPQTPMSYFDHPKTFLYVECSLRRLSFLMIIPISVNQYALICRPFTHNIVTARKSTLIQIIALTVFVAVTGIYEFYPKEMTLYFYTVCRFIFFAMMSIVLPLITSFVLTVLVIREFRRRNRILEDSVSSGVSFRQGERNVTRAMIAVNLAFVIFTLPTLVMNIIYFFTCERGSTCHFALIFLVITTDINYFVNIFIYTFHLPKFKSTLFGLFKCKCSRKRENESIPMSGI